MRKPRMRNCQVWRGAGPGQLIDVTGLQTTCELSRQLDPSRTTRGAWGRLSASTCEDIYRQSRPERPRPATLPACDAIEKQHHGRLQRPAPPPPPPPVEPTLKAQAAQQPKEMWPSPLLADFDFTGRPLVFSWELPCTAFPAVCGWRLRTRLRQSPPPRPPADEKSKVTCLQLDLGTRLRRVHSSSLLGPSQRHKASSC